jgi:hypothetical protein
VPQPAPEPPADRGRLRAAPPAARPCRIQRLLERVDGIDAVPLALLRVTHDSEEAFGIIAAERRGSQPHRELVLVASERVLGATVHI